MTLPPKPVLMAAVPPPTAAPKCPRHVRAAAALPNFRPVRARIQWSDLHREPFRVFFPLAVIAGLIGVILWPLMLGGWMEEYPGPRHARLMIEGFFGGFVLGFLGTSLPRLLETKPLRGREVFPALLLHGASIAAYAVGTLEVGDGLFLAGLGVCLVALARRVPARLDLPPPGFVMIPMGFLCLAASMALDWLGRTRELPPEADLLARLLGYHGFILLCILGAGGFLLPRFLGLGVREKFATSPRPTPAWRNAMFKALAAAVGIAGSYPLEAAGWTRTATVIRAFLVGAYLWSVMPMEKLRWSWSGVQWFLVVGLASIPAGILASGFWPGWRVALSHVELIGGFGLITLGVATRVVFGHSGQRARLERVHPALTVAAVLMLLGLLSRLSGDLIPAIQLRHYWYGAACWIAGLGLWAFCVLPHVLKPDPEA